MGSVAVADFQSCAQISLPKAKNTAPTTTGPTDHEALDTRSLWPNGTVLQVNVIG